VTKAELAARERRLLDALAKELVVHEHECRAWRMGKRHGPCTCNAVERGREHAEEIASGERSCP
jgi:hypothetical protein